MADQTTRTQQTLAAVKEKLELLEELELLESEFTLITNEYHQRHRHLEERILRLDPDCSVSRLQA